jgi:selenocysteine lyase/cysteine desulfurase
MGKAPMSAAHSEKISIAEARKLFPGASQGIFMDVAARGILPAATERVVMKLLQERSSGTVNKDELFDTIERVRSLYAKMINATPTEIAFTKNVSDGINSIAAAVDWKPGDNVVLCPVLEHPTNIYPWVNQKHRHGIEIRIIDDEGGHMPVEKMIAAIDSRTRVVSASLVSFSPGFKTDVVTLGAACRKRGAIFVVDGAQGIGIVHLDMQTMPIDILSVSTQKGLCAFYGLGFLYARREIAEQLRPVYLSRFGVEIGNSHEAAVNIEDYELMPAAQRFEVGNYNYLGAVGVEPALDILTRVGTDAIEKHVSALTHDMVRKLHDRGVPVYSGKPGPHLTHIVALGEGIDPNHNEYDDSDISSFARLLRNGGVRLSVRRGMIRLSLHLYNNQDDVDRLVEIASGWNRIRDRKVAVGS